MSNESTSVSHIGSKKVQLSSKNGEKKLDVNSDEKNLSSKQVVNNDDKSLSSKGKEEVKLVKVEKAGSQVNKKLIGHSEKSKRCSVEGEVLKKFSKDSGKINVREMVELFEVINKSGLPNFKGCRVPVPVSKNFNMVLWRSKLVAYEDNVVCEFLEFGFPLDFDRDKKLDYTVRRNHKVFRIYHIIFKEEIRIHARGGSFQ